VLAEDRVGRYASFSLDTIARLERRYAYLSYLTALAAVSYSHTLSVPFCRKHASFGACSDYKASS
jgi:hypothetical protein